MSRPFSVQMGSAPGVSHLIYLMLVGLTLTTSFHARLAASKSLQPGQFNPRYHQPSPHINNQERLGRTKDDRAQTHCYRTVHSLDVLNTEFFDLTTGSYPTAIQWTSAFIQTQLTSTLETSLRLYPQAKDNNDISDYIDHFLPQLTAFFAQQPVDELLQNEANDDLLWVVLGWLSASRFLKAHEKVYGNKYANWISSFESRAKMFYDAAAKGWDTRLCQGGIFWNPHLPIPYKNAITNELYISASIEMYLYYPGKHEKYLQNAKQGYGWLNHSGMRNDAGLYTDGFHISNMSIAECDVRSEQTWTYNQGVVLSGLRGLFQVTGDEAYMKDAHRLIKNVIYCEGKVGQLIRSGILEESCDSLGICNQDAQMFKGIFMHHLALFCSNAHNNTDIHPSTLHSHSHSHSDSCHAYSSFIIQNAAAAWSSRNLSTKVMGGWWSAPDHFHPHLHLSSQASNNGKVFSKSKFNTQLLQGKWNINQAPKNAEHYIEPSLTGTLPGVNMIMCSVDDGKDLNDRGRGRTVESHAGGLAALRAAWEVEDLVLDI